MTTAVIYARVPSELKEEILKVAKKEGKQQGETLTDLVQKGLHYSAVTDEINHLRDQLSALEKGNQTTTNELERTKSELELARRNLIGAQRAKEHLERILNVEVGRCTVPNCGEHVTLYGFAFQQCPRGHSKTIELYDEYKKMPGLGETIVAGLAIIGGVALAAELLGSKGPA